jgi:nucleoside-diphosphate-sugar epimerase
MAANRILIAGGRGLVGRAAVEHFETRGWEVVGLARHGADFPTRAAFVQVDLRDRDACATAIGALRGVTHLVYAALYEKPDLASGWVDPAHIETNLTMLRNLMQPLRASCPDLQHVTLLQGTKAYGAHLGRMQVPAKERRPRVEHPNFYFAQEDWLRARQAEDARWALSILRPQIVCGVAIGAPMNVVATIGAFAALRRELGLPLFHPGHPDAVTEAVDAQLLAEALEWVATTPRCAGETYNIANGDVLLWRDVWPAIAAHFGMKLGEDAPVCLAHEMPRQAELWSQLARRTGLRCSLDELIGSSWQYADMTWASAAPPSRPSLVSTIKARQHGFGACRDTEDMLIAQLQQMQDEKLLPA